MSESLARGFTIGPYRVLPRQNRLEGPEGELHVEPKVMEVLLVLADRPGELVSRQELLDAVWGDVVVLDETLTKAIQVLRGHLGDKPISPEFIRTVPRKGYELIAPIGPLGERTGSETPTHAAPMKSSHRAVSTPAEMTREVPESPTPGTVGMPAGRRQLLIVGALLLVIVLAAALTYRGLIGREPVTVAVIPPVAAGDVAELGFVGEGLADYLLDQLSHSKRLEVVARRSSFFMRDTDTNVRAIGERLGARYLVEGSLRQDEDGLLLSLFLVDTDTGTNIWTTQLRGAVDGVPQLQRRSGELLRGAIRRELGVAVPVAGVDAPTVPEPAYRKYLEARYQWSLRGSPRIDRSIALLEEALAIEPDYAAAHLALAHSVAIRPFYTDVPVASQFELARVSAARALALDPSLEADVSALEGFMRFKERRWIEARDALERALAIAPDNVNALYWYSWYLSQIGRFDEALPHLLVAQKLDPVSAVVNDRLAIAYCFVGDLDRAAERYRVSVDLGYVESTNPLGLILFYYRAGRFDDLEELMLRLGGDPLWVEPTVAALAAPQEGRAVGDLIDAIEAPDALLQRARFGIWMLSGDTDRAFRDFQPGPKSEYVEAIWLQEAAHMRADDRFDALLASLGFVGAERSVLTGY